MTPCMRFISGETISMLISLSSFLWHDSEQAGLSERAWAGKQIFASPHKVRKPSRSTSTRSNRRTPSRILKLLTVGDGLSNLCLGMVWLQAFGRQSNSPKTPNYISFVKNHFSPNVNIKQIIILWLFLWHYWYLIYFNNMYCLGSLAGIIYLLILTRSLNGLFWVSRAWANRGLYW